MSVAPMMDWTDLYFRQLTRLLSRHTWLYTEMVVVSRRVSQQWSHASVVSLAPCRRCTGSRSWSADVAQHSLPSGGRLQCGAIPLINALEHIAPANFLIALTACH